MTLANYLKTFKLRFVHSRFFSAYPHPSIPPCDKIVSKVSPTTPELVGFVRSFGGAFPPLARLSLPSALFAVPPRIDLIHRVVCWYRAGMRAGLASAKGRGEVAGSNRKIHAQKGTGRARAGDARAPHRRGGITFIHFN